MSRAHATRCRRSAGARAIAVLCALLATGGCGAESALAPAVVAEEWELVAIGSGVVVPSDPQLPTLRFLSATAGRSSGTIMGRTPCNLYSGTYRFAGYGQLRLDGSFSTDVSCGAAADQFEGRFFAYLGAVNRFEYHADTLVLITASHDSLRFGARRAE